MSTFVFGYCPSSLPKKDLEQKGWETLPPKVFDESNSDPLFGN